MNSYYSGKRVWITGASSGIGEQLTYQLAQAGAQLIISSRKTNDLERVKQNSKHPAFITIIPLDLADEQSIRQAAEKVFSEHKTVDILINNGGISQRAFALDTPMEVVRRIFEVNFFGNILLSKLVGEKMVAQKSGHIVVMSSLLGKWGFHMRSSYAATKHALHGFYDSMRMETEKDGMLISIVTPGFIATEISVHAVNEKGEQTNEMDNNQAGGISAEECARRILDGVAAQKTEFAVGGREITGLKVRRFFPKMFEGILRKRSAR